LEYYDYAVERQGWFIFELCGDSNFPDLEPFKDTICISYLKKLISIATSCVAFLVVEFDTSKPL
jgi:hypothetical protein